MSPTDDVGPIGAVIAVCWHLIDAQCQTCQLLKCFEIEKEATIHNNTSVVVQLGEFIMRTADISTRFKFKSEYCTQKHLQVHDSQNRTFYSPSDWIRM